MHIRRIRINRFGCWEDLVIPALEACLDVIHLDDGGRPAEFARFLAGMLFEFGDEERNVEGSIEVGDSPPYLSLSRLVSHDGRRQWRLSQAGKPIADSAAGLRRVQGDIDPILTSRLLFPHGTLEERWEWLTQNPDVVDWLLGQNHPAYPSIESLSHLSLSRHGCLIQELGEQRDHLIEEIGRHYIQMPAPPIVASRHVPQEVVLAELTDELRVLKRKLVPLKAAHEIADKWQELQRLESLDTGARNVGELRALLSEYRELNDEARDCERALQRALARPQQRNSAETSDQEFEIRQLLDREHWVRQIACHDVSDDAGTDTSPNAELEREIQRAARLLENAQRENARRQRDLLDFAEAHGLDMANLGAQEEDATNERAELNADDPIARQPPEQKLAELKRRRLWVNEERVWLLGRQQLSSNMLLTVALLFSLSIASLFGVLLVATPPYQWALTALGLCGIVASGAVKLTYERRMARLLCRAVERLQRIDREAAALLEDVLDQDDLTVEARTGQRAKALQLRLDATEARRRLDSAEASFRELLAAAGLPVNLSPAEAMEAVGKRRIRGSVSENKRPTAQARRLRRWLKRARKAVYSVDGYRPTQDPIELLELLEEIYQRLRGQSRKPTTVSRPGNGDKVKRARRDLKRIETRQSEILGLAGVADDYALSTELKAAEQDADTIRRIKSLGKEINVTIECHEDGAEIRELLERFNPNDLGARYNAAMQAKTDVEHEFRRLPSDSPVKQVREMSEAERSTEHLRLQLGVIETRLRQAIRAGQTGMVLRRIASEILHGNQDKTADMSYLRRMTKWDSVELDGNRFVLQNANERIAVDDLAHDSQLAWLALQMMAVSKLRRSGGAVPLVLLADELFSDNVDFRVLNVLQELGQSGLQILLLVGKHGIVRQLTDAGVPIVRIGLREEHPRSLFDLDDTLPSAA